MKSKFKVGDKVQAFGIDGEVTIVNEDIRYGVMVKMDSTTGNHYIAFTEDGMYFDWHNRPSLELIERPVRYIEKTVYQGVGPDYISRYYHDTIKEAMEDSAYAVGYTEVKIMVKE